MLHTCIQFMGSYVMRDGDDLSVEIMMASRTFFPYRKNIGLSGLRYNLYATHGLQVFHTGHLDANGNVGICKRKYRF